MSGVVDLDSRRPPEGDPPMTCLVCGGQWFRVYAVTLRTDATVSGYAGDPECIDCHPVTVPAS